MEPLGLAATPFPVSALSKTAHQLLAAAVPQPAVWRRGHRSGSDRRNRRKWDRIDQFDGRRKCHGQCFCNRRGHSHHSTAGMGGIDGAGTATASATGTGVTASSAPFQPPRPLKEGLPALAPLASAMEATEEMRWPARLAAMPAQAPWAWAPPPTAPAAVAETALASTAETAEPPPLAPSSEVPPAAAQSSSAPTPPAVMVRAVTTTRVPAMAKWLDRHRNGDFSRWRGSPRQRNRHWRCRRIQFQRPECGQWCRWLDRHRDGKFHRWRSSLRQRNRHWRARWYQFQRRDRREWWECIDRQRFQPLIGWKFQSQPKRHRRRRSARRTAERVGPEATQSQTAPSLSTPRRLLPATPPLPAVPAANRPL